MRWGGVGGGSGSGRGWWVRCEWDEMGWSGMISFNSLRESQAAKTGEKESI